MRAAFLVLAPAPPPDTAPGDGDGGGGGGGGGAGGGPGGALASATFERIDDSGDCAGLVPARAPEPVTIRRSPPAGATCMGGVSDGTGAVAVAARAASGAVSWQAFAPGGNPAGSFEASQVFAQPSGWNALRVAPSAGPETPLVEHVAIEPDGTAANAVTVSGDPAHEVGFRWSFSQDPRGGGFVVFRSVGLAGNHFHKLVGHRFDAGGAARWPGGTFLESDSDSHGPLFLAGGVSNSGDALVLYQRSAFLVADWWTVSGDPAVRGEWTERYGPIVGDSLQHALELKPLLDGSLALRADGTWRRVYAHLATAPSPLPGWLGSRADWTYQFTRGNRGYAAFPPPGRASADCTQTIDLVSRGGRLCGRVVLREDGSGCVTGAVDQGWDGTVVQQSGRDPCAARWWPRLLAGD